MAKKEKQDKDKEEKEIKKEVAEEKKKVEKRVTKKQPEIKIRLYSLEELSNLFGVSVSEMRSLYLRRGLDKNVKLSLQEARNKLIL